jgi:hypothetical protein
VQAPSGGHLLAAASLCVLLLTADHMLCAAMREGGGGADAAWKGGVQRAASTQPCQLHRAGTACDHTCNQNPCTAVQGWQRALPCLGGGGPALHSFAATPSLHARGAAASRQGRGLAAGSELVSGCRKCLTTAPCKIVSARSDALRRGNASACRSHGPRVALISAPRIIIRLPRPAALFDGASAG